MDHVNDARGTEDINYLDISADHRLAACHIFAVTDVFRITGRRVLDDELHFRWFRVMLRNMIEVPVVPTEFVLHRT